MKVIDLIQQLGKYADKDTCVYINYEKNWEDQFRVVKSDAGSVLLIPLAKYDELKDSQEFYFIED